MTKQEAIEHFGGKAINLANALGIKPSSVTQWGDEIPEVRQYQIEVLTDGKLKAERKQAVTVR